MVVGILCFCLPLERGLLESTRPQHLCVIAFMSISHNLLIKSQVITLLSTSLVLKVDKEEGKD